MHLKHRSPSSLNLSHCYDFFSVWTTTAFSEEGKENRFQESKEQISLVTTGFLVLINPPIPPFLPTISSQATLYQWLRGLQNNLWLIILPQKKLPPCKAHSLHLDETFFFRILNTDLFKWSFGSCLTWHMFVFFYINLAYKVRTKTVEMYHMSIPFIGIQLIFSTGKEKKGNYSHRNGDSAHHSTQYYILQGEHGLGGWYLLSFWSVSDPECLIHKDSFHLCWKSQRACHSNREQKPAVSHILRDRSVSAMTLSQVLLRGTQVSLYSWPSETDPMLD